jgi:hypothetical protein
MGVIRLDGLPLRQPEAEPWPDDEHSVRVDEMFARQLDNEFSAGVRGLLHDPETGIAAKSGEAALEAIAGAMPALAELKGRTLAQAIGPRQRSILEPMIETRLGWAAGTLGQLARRATVEVDDQSVAERIAGLNQDAATAWQDPAYLRKLGRSTVEELRYQGERRGWDPAQTDVKVRGGLSDLYAGAVESAIGQDLDGAAALYDHARPVIDPERQATLDRRFVQAREAVLYRDVDRDMAGIPIDPAGPPGAEVFEERAAELTPEDASDDVRARIGEVADFARRRAERQLEKQQAEAAVAALDWLKQNPDAPLVVLPQEVRDWLAPDQWEGLGRAAISGRVETDPEIHDRLDRQTVYEPERFMGIDLDRYRLQLDDREFGRLVAIQRAEAEGQIDPAQARWSHTLTGIDRALETKGIDLESLAAREARRRARADLDSFEVIEGRPPRRADLDGIVRRTAEAAEPPPVDSAPIAPEAAPQEASTEDSTTPDPEVAPAGAEITRFDDGTRLVMRRGVETERGTADVTEAYDEQDRLASTVAVFADGHRVESRWSYPGEMHWSQIDTVRDPEGGTLGTVTTTFDGERVTRTVEPVDGPSQTEIWDRDGPVATAHKVFAPVLAPAIPYLLGLTAAAIAALTGKAIGDAVDRPGSSEMARPSDKTPGLGHNNPPEPVDREAPDPGAPPPPQFPDAWKYAFPLLTRWLSQRAQVIDRDQYTGADGIDTAVGVRLDPRVGEPAAGLDYLPDHESHRKGLRGEYGLANDIARHFPDHTVIDFGRKVGERGPDVISVDRNGEIHFWDSKWRGSDTSIGPGQRAHQSERSLKESRKPTADAIEAAMESGRLSPEAGSKAQENLKNRNVTIVTVGTGSARNGVIERIVGGERAVVHPERRP